jgi:hypothetical protein
VRLWLAVRSRLAAGVVSSCNQRQQPGQQAGLLERKFENVDSIRSSFRDFQTM